MELKILSVTHSVHLMNQSNNNNERERAMGTARFRPPLFRSDDRKCGVCNEVTPNVGCPTIGGHFNGWVSC